MVRAKDNLFAFEDKNFEISSKSDVTANGASDNKRSSLLFCVTLASEQTQSTENGRSEAKSQSLNIWDRRFNRALGLECSLCTVLHLPKKL